MSYLVRKGQLVSPVYNGGQTSYYVHGPAPLFSLFQETVSLMEAFERIGATACNGYRAVQREALRQLQISPENRRHVKRAE